MSKKRVRRLLIFTSITIVCLFAGVFYMNVMGATTIRAGESGAKGIGVDITESQSKEAVKTASSAEKTQAKPTEQAQLTEQAKPTEQVQPTTTANQGKGGNTNTASGGKSTNTNKPAKAKNTMGTTALIAPDLGLIYDSTQVNYMKYIPKLQLDANLESQLDFPNPKLVVDAKAALLFDTSTKEILYYKNPIKPVFPASTTKLLTILTALDYCKQNEKVKIGNEITMIAPDSTRAHLIKGEVLTVRNLIEGMLLPSGNDAAYALATYAGRKCLGNARAGKKAAVIEFVRQMNIKAKKIGVRNSCFKTPDGYDALGMYTTAFDMGMIGLAAARNPIILSVAKKSSSTNKFLSGQTVTWTNTNGLINPNSQWYYARAFGLKTGTSTMAGRCLIAAARDEKREVLCVVMNSTSTGRFADARKLLKYGLTGKVE